MDYLDVNQFHDRMRRLREIMRLQPTVTARLSAEDREVIERYYLGAIQADDPTEYRATAVKDDPTIELAADRAYNNLLGLAGVSETLTEPDGDYDADLKR